MGTCTLKNQETMKLVLKAFGEASHKNYGSHSYEAGYLESVIVGIMPLLLKRQQNVLIENMVLATLNQEEEIIRKLKKEVV